jgi:AcrR family transcriptional regulator
MSMAGLRLRNKEDRNRRILESAARQFRGRGFDRVKIDEIAEIAAVSVGTIYNYYQSKGDIVVALVSLEVNEVLALGEKLLAKPPKDPAKAISNLICCYIDHSLTYLSKEMWCQAMAISTIQPNSPAGDSYNKLDAALREQVIRMVEKLITMKLVRADIDAEALGSVLFHSQNDMFINFVKNDAQSLYGLKKHLRRNLRAVVDLIAT